MRKKKAEPINLNDRELQLIQGLREHPEVFERVQTILEITRNSDGSLKTADEVENLLIEEMRRLGNTTMSNWASNAEKHVAQEFNKKEPSAQAHKKKR
jgi:hypothetical protein